MLLVDTNLEIQCHPNAVYNCIVDVPGRVGIDQIAADSYIVSRGGLAR